MLEQYLLLEWIITSYECTCSTAFSHTCLCVCVCPVCAVTFEILYLETSFHVCRYIPTICRLNSLYENYRPRSRPQEHKTIYTCTDIAKYVQLWVVHLWLQDKLVLDFFSLFCYLQNRHSERDRQERERNERGKTGVYTTVKLVKVIFKLESDVFEHRKRTALLNIQLVSSMSCSQKWHTATYCVEREQHLRKKPMPTRFRNDQHWELYIRNFPDDTTEVVIHSLFFVFSIVLSCKWLQFPKQWGSSPQNTKVCFT